MSAADDGRFEWAGRANTFPEALAGVFAQRANLFSPSFLRWGG